MSSGAHPGGEEGADSGDSESDGSEDGEITEPRPRRRKGHRAGRACTRALIRQAKWDGTYDPNRKHEVTSKVGTGEAALINVGLQLEHTQAMISTKLAGHNDDSLASLCAKLNRDLSSWRQEQLVAFPDLSNELSVVDASTPEKALLLLPSSLKPEKRVALRLDGLAVIEYKLREGQAHDALAELQLAIKTCNANLKFKKKYVHGQKPNTRAQQYLRILKAEKKV
ncbi:hypothetical protein LshimejAT787_1303790 [Lyophyllum shimeji]|uniref:Uncharacterized protein n=1 Tax=Lyophyllum shimeji TaxID=47721 RepID=A0A9P3USB7_LYOSH|nr:hypothetical protein LshimejAT787_1303790 [Lyophyllum shimeji]